MMTAITWDEWQAFAAGWFAGALSMWAIVSWLMLRWRGP